MQNLQNPQYTVLFLLLGTILIISFLANICLGSVYIPLKAIGNILTGSEVFHTSWQHIILSYRLPKAITATIVGCALGVSGILMQTLFKNPMAGPFVLGISSGASLGVSFVLLGASFLGILGVANSSLTIVLASCFGSMLVLALVLFVSFRVRDTMAILIIGLMFGSITTAIVSILSYFASAQKLQQYLFWGYGTFGNLSWNEIYWLAACFAIGMVLAISAIKALNALLLGEQYAQSMGIKIQRSRILIILATSLLAGSSTAFVGPIAFVGFAIPHLARQWIPATDHKIFLPAVMLCGSILMLICDSIAQLPNSSYTLPINAITPFVGAPVLIWILVRKRKMIF